MIDLDWALLLCALFLIPLSTRKTEQITVFLSFFLSIFISFYMLSAINQGIMDSRYYFLTISAIDFLSILILYLLKSRLLLVGMYFLSMFYNHLTFLEYALKTRAPFYDYYTEFMLIVMLAILGYGFFNNGNFQRIKGLWPTFRSAVYRSICLFQHKVDGSVK